MSLTRAPDKTQRVLRFDRVQRSAHWATALLFLSLMITAIPLYYGSLFGIVLPRHLIEMIHLWSGLALPLPIIISLIGPWGSAMRRDVRRINYWTREEIRWIRTRGASNLKADKFNPGQKLNAIFVGASILMMLVTGTMLQWFRFFPVSWRSGATVVHDVFAYAIFFVVIGHVVLALTHRDALQSMFKGWVSSRWAERHAARWLEEGDVVEVEGQPLNLKRS
jgi:formate dehydrogenase subunit gamma